MYRKSREEKPVVDLSPYLEKKGTFEILPGLGGHFQQRQHRLLYSSRAKPTFIVKFNLLTMLPDEMDRSQREVYLRHQMKAIMSELGEGNELGDEIERCREKARELDLSPQASEEIDRQLKKLERMHPDAA